MKKILIIALALVVAISIIGCTSKPADEPTGYPNGVHTGLSKANDKGYVEAVVTVENGKITNVEMKEFRGDGSQKTKENYTYQPWLTAVDELPAAVIEKQSPEVDNITGATSTTEKFKQAVKIALGLEQSAAGPYKNGVYKAESDLSGRGGKVEVEMVVLNGTITLVKMTEFDGQGNAKTKEDYTYEPWHEAFDQLPAQVIAKQSADVDTVSGATSTTNMFIQAVERAIEKAK